MQETWDYDLVRAAARPVSPGSALEVTEIRLEDGESAWHPTSTERSLYGPSTLVYEFHPAQVTVYEFDLGECVGQDRIEEYPFWRKCDQQAEPGSTRCAAHPRAEVPA